MKRSNEVRDAVLSFFEELERGDLSRLTRDEDLLVIGTDPEEYWKGEVAVKTWSQQMEALGGGFSFTAGDVEAWQEGPIAWAVDRPRMNLPDGSSLSVRMSLVLNRQGADWKVVHAHGSIGVANQEVGGFGGLTSSD